FGATRTTRYPIPEFLFPRRVQVPVFAADTVPPDSAFLALYADAARAPSRFYAAQQGQPAAARRPPAAAGASPGATPPAGQPAPGDSTPPDSAFLALYADTLAGPFRFAGLRRQPAAPAQPPITSDAPAEPAPDAGAEQAPAAEPEEDAAAQAERPQPTRRSEERS